MKHCLTEDATGEPTARTKSGTPFNDARGLDLSFADADLREADFARDTLEGVNFEDAKIAGANFSDVNIEDSRLDVLMSVPSIDVAL